VWRVEWPTAQPARASDEREEKRDQHDRGLGHSRRDVTLPAIYAPIATEAGGIIAIIPRRN
jgi:hypothetical protein